MGSSTSKKTFSAVPPPTQAAPKRVGVLSSDEAHDAKALVDAFAKIAPAGVSFAMGEDDDMLAYGGRMAMAPLTLKVRDDAVVAFAPQAYSNTISTYLLEHKLLTVPMTTPVVLVLTGAPPAAGAAMTEDRLRKVLANRRYRVVCAGAAASPTDCAAVREAVSWAMTAAGAASRLPDAPAAAKGVSAAKPLPTALEANVATASPMPAAANVA